MINTTVIGILNGIVGDYLKNTDNELSISMDFYHHKQAINRDISIVEKEYPLWQDTICIFLHGSTATESFWHKKGKPDYGYNLYEKFKILPLYIRYNSGLHISENGKQLGILLEDFLDNERIKKVIIVGHSMGGLVFRSACYYAGLFEYRWLDKIKHVFYLGSPHHGAPLEKFGALTQSILEKISNPFTSAIHKVIDLRSNGIKDLRHGYLIDEEWLSEENDHFPINRKISFPIMKDIHKYIVVATISENTDSLLSNWFGDFMVRKDSALGKSSAEKHHLDFNQENILFTGNTTHLSLMYHPKVNEFILNKLGDYFTA